MTIIDIFERCLSLGMTEAGAAGCVANILAESAGRPTNVEDRSNISDEIYTANVNNGQYTDFVNDRYGYGLCQWTLPSRKQALLAYAKSCGMSIGDADMQFAFMKKEMMDEYPKVWNTLTSTDDPYVAGHVMCMQYERPANTEASARIRGNRSKEIYDQCKGTKPKTYYDPKKVIDLALSQIGYHEKESNSDLDDPTANPGDKNWTKYARDLDKLSGFYNGPKNGFAWCESFVDWCFVKSYGRSAAQELLCQPNNSAGAGCLYSAQYFQNKGQFYKKDPKPGDQIFFGTSENVYHTGLVVEVTSINVIVVEGNTSDMVAKRTYSLNDSKIYGYGRPKYGMPAGNLSTPDISVDPPKYSWCNPKIPELKKGDSNGYVRSTQILLIEHGFYCGGKTDDDGVETPDGDFGLQTEASVKEFQRKAKLKVDGVIGANTWAALLDL